MKQRLARLPDGNHRGSRDDAVSRLLNQKDAIKLLEEHGWTRATGGKHAVKMTKPGRRPVTLPRHRGQDYGPGLTAAIKKQAGIR